VSADGAVRIRIGTRGSKLALAQANGVARLLEKLGAAVEISVIRTSGDAGAEPLSESPTGIFVREIEQALLSGEVDLAIHSLKDLPTERRPGLTICAIPERADPHDALVTQSGGGLSDLLPGSKVATSSPRRAAQLRAHRPDLVMVGVRGNVDTRLRKLEEQQFDAVVLAYAGLARLGLRDRVSEVIPFEVCLPAPGQGALALQTRSESGEVGELIRRLDHQPTRLAVTAERAFLAGLGAGCTVPAGALGLVQGDWMRLQGVVAEAAGASVLRREVTGPAQEAESMGSALADELLGLGAQRMVSGQ
jgi:hydroxymethylbilane synthase